MDYFTKQLDEEINSKLYGIRLSIAANNGPRGSMEALNLVRAKIEYGLVFQLAVLWHANVDSFRNTSQRVDFLEKLIKPPLGVLWRLLKDLNKLNKKHHGFEYTIAGGMYLDPRNEILGHGWTFTEEEAYNQLMGAGDFGGFLNICNELYDSSDILKDNYLIIQPDQIYATEIIGASFTNDGAIQDWQYSNNMSQFTLYDVFGYNLNKHEYIHLSPFICLDRHQMRRQRLCRVFQGVADPVLGKAKYNTLFESDLWTQIYDEFKHAQQINGVGYGANGIKYNEYETSYNKYIAHDYHIRYISSIENFLDKKSTVTLTLQGQGGLGKTALIQYILGKIISGQSKTLSQNFDCIIFCTAKTIRYDVALQTVAEYSYKGYTASYEDILQLINRMLEAYHSNDVKQMEHKVINSDSKFILVIDDFESFSEIERTKIATFVGRLDVNKHKVIITTRIANFYAIGEERPMTHLSPSDTMIFLQQYLADKNSSLTISPHLHQVIHDMTTGNSLFVIQLAELMLQFGIENAMAQRPGQRDKDIKFLYGKIYDSLTPLAQKIFVVMGGMVNNRNLSNLIEKLRFVVEAEMNDAFDVSLQKLVRMHIIKIPNDKVFEVYNEQIWNIMRGFWDGLNQDQKKKYENTINKIEASRTDLDLNNALLQNLKLREQSEALADVIEEYRSILLRPDDNCPLDVKLVAINNLLDYLNSNLQVSMLIKICREFKNQYESHYVFVKRYAEIFWNIGLGSYKVKLELRNAAYISESFNIIISYLAISNNNTSKFNIDALELRGVLVERLCIDYLRQSSLQRQDRRDPSTEVSFKEKQRADFYKIRDEGQKLFRLCQGIDIDIAQIQTDESLNNAISKALYQYAYLSNTRYQFEEVIQIVDFLKKIITDANSDFARDVEDLGIDANNKISQVEDKINEGYYSVLSIDELSTSRPDLYYFPFKLMTDNQKVHFIRNVSLVNPSYFAFVQAIMKLSHVRNIDYSNLCEEFDDLRDEDTERILQSTERYYLDRGVNFLPNFGNSIIDSFKLIRNCINLIEANQSSMELQMCFDQLNNTEKRYVIMRMLNSTNPLHISFVAGLGNDERIYSMFVDSLDTPNIDKQVYFTVKNKYADKYMKIVLERVAYVKIMEMIHNKRYISEFPRYFGYLDSLLCASILHQCAYDGMLSDDFGQQIIAFIIGISGLDSDLQKTIKSKLSRINSTILTQYDAIIKSAERDFGLKYKHIAGYWWARHKDFLNTRVKKVNNANHSIDEIITVKPYIEPSRKPFPTELKIGDQYVGTISGFITSGVLIDIGVGYDGFIHHDFALSTWQKGDKVKVKVYKVDTAKKQIILSVPFPTELKVGDQHTGTITRFTTSGVLIDIGVDYNGFIHHDFALSTWKIGDKIKVKVYKVDIVKQQIVLTPMSYSFGS